MVKRYKITGWDCDIDDHPDGSYVDYEDYQKLEEEREFLKKQNKEQWERIQNLFRELYPPEEWERIDDTPPNEIMYPWALNEDKDG